MLQLIVAWLGAAAFMASLGYFLFSYLFTYGVPVASGDAGSALAPALFDCALFTVFALHHSLFARTRLKTIVNARLSPTLERTFYTWVASLLFAAACWLWRPVPGVLYSVPPPWSWIGYAAQVAGVLMTYVAGQALDTLELAGVRQVMRARHGSAPTPQIPLKTTGVYGLVRHPLYFGWVLVVFGAPYMTATRFTFAVISTLYLAVAIPFEERGLDETFGPAYEHYRRQVRWKMLPFVY